MRTRTEILYSCGAIGDGHAAHVRTSRAITLETIRDAGPGGNIDRATFARVISEMDS
jgi:hypothetical protein